MAKNLIIKLFTDSKIVIAIGTLSFSHAPEKPLRWDSSLRRN